MKLTMTSEPVETTTDGLFGGPPPSPYRTFIAGPRRYWADDVEITKERFLELLREQT